MCLISAGIYASVDVGKLCICAGLEALAKPVPMPASTMSVAGHRAQSSGSVDSAGGGEGQTLSSLLPFGTEELGSSGGMDVSADDVNKNREKNRNAQVCSCSGC